MASQVSASGGSQHPSASEGSHSNVQRQGVLNRYRVTVQQCVRESLAMSIVTGGTAFASCMLGRLFGSVPTRTVVKITTLVAAMGAGVQLLRLAVRTPRQQLESLLDRAREHQLTCQSLVIPKNPTSDDLTACYMKLLSLRKTYPVAVHGDVVDPLERFNCGATSLKRELELVKYYMAQHQWENRDAMEAGIKQIGKVLRNQLQANEVQLGLTDWEIMTPVERLQYVRILCQFDVLQNLVEHSSDDTIRAEYALYLQDCQQAVLKEIRSKKARYAADLAIVDHHNP